MVNKHLISRSITSPAAPTHLRLRSLALLMDLRSSSLISAGCSTAAVTRSGLTLTNNNANIVSGVSCVRAHMSVGYWWGRRETAGFYTHAAHIHRD